MKSCFIITPVGPDKSDIRRMADGVIYSCVIPVLKELEFEPIVPHKMTEPGSIERSIINNLLNCDLVIANLTGLNPNVMYELAVRHASCKPVVCIAEASTNLPFDIYSQRVQFYTDDMYGVDELKSALPACINDALRSYPSNPIINAQNGFKITEHASDFEKTTLGMLETLINSIRPMQKEPKNTYRKVRSDGSTTFYVCTSSEALEYRLIERGYKLILNDNRFLGGIESY